MDQEADMEGTSEAWGNDDLDLRLGPGRNTKVSRPRRPPPVVGSKRVWKSKSQATSRPQSADSSTTNKTMESLPRVPESPRPQSAVNSRPLSPLGDAILARRNESADKYRGKPLAPIAPSPRYPQDMVPPGQMVGNNRGNQEVSDNKGLEVMSDNRRNEEVGSNRRKERLEYDGIKEEITDHKDRENLTHNIKDEMGNDRRGRRELATPTDSFSEPSRSVNFSNCTAVQERKTELKKKRKKRIRPEDSYWGHDYPTKSPRSSSDLSHSSSGTPRSKGFHEYRRERQQKNDEKMLVVESNLRKYGTDVQSVVTMLKAYGYRRPISIPKPRKKPATPRYIRRKPEPARTEPTRTYSDYTDEDDEDVSDDKETKYVDNNNWPSDSPAAGVYDIRNTSAKMVMYNNKRPSTTNRLRGYSDQKVPREPSPNRHLPNLVHKKNPDRHTECSTSVYPPYEPDTRMSWPVRDPNHPEGTSADPNRHMYCHIDPETLKYLHLHGPVRTKQVLARTPPDNLSADEYPFLQHPQLSNSERRYLSSVASVYSTSKMKTIKQNQYRNLLRKQLRLGFASAAEYEKYMRYLEGPRMTEQGNQGNQQTDKSSKNKKSEPLLSRRRAAQEGKATKHDTPSGPSPYTEDQARGVNEPAGGRDTPAGRRKKSAKRRDPDAPRPQTAPGGGAPRGLRHGWGENDQEGRRPTPRKSEFAFLQAVTNSVEADDEAEEEFVSSRHAGHISVDSVSEAGSTQSAVPHPPQTPREGYGRPRSRLGRKKPQHEEFDDEEQIPEDADNNQDNSLVVVIENGSIASDSQTREENNDQTPAKQPDVKAVQTGDEDEPEDHKDVGTSLSDFKAFLASQKKAEMVETGTSMEDERAARRERKRRRREQRAKLAEEHRKLNMSGANVNVAVTEQAEQPQANNDDATSMVSTGTETGTSTFMTSETTASSEQQTSKPDHPDPEPKDTDTVSAETQTAAVPDPKDALAEQAEPEYPVMEVRYREPQQEPEIVEGKLEIISMEVVAEPTEVAEAEPQTASADPDVVIEKPSAPEIVSEGEADQQEPIPELKLDTEQAAEDQADKVIAMVTAKEDDTNAQTQTEGQEKIDESPTLPTPSAPTADPNTNPAAPVVNANVNASLISLNSDMASPRPIESSRPFSPFQEVPIEVSDGDEMSVDMRIESPDPIDTAGTAGITSPPGPPTPEPAKHADNVQKDVPSEVESPRTEPVAQAEVLQQDGVQETQAAVQEQQETVIQVEGREITDSAEVKQEENVVEASITAAIDVKEAVSDKVEEGAEAPAITVTEQKGEGSTESQVEVEAGGAKVEQESVAKSENDEAQVIEEVKKEVTDVQVIEEVKKEVTEAQVIEEVKKEVTEAQVIEEVKKEVTEAQVIEEVKKEVTEAQVIEEVKKEVAEAVEKEEGEEKADANQADSTLAEESAPKEEAVQNENQDQGDLDVSKGVITVQDISIAPEAANKDVDSEVAEEQKASSGEEVASLAEQGSDSKEVMVEAESPAKVDAESPADSADQTVEKSGEVDDKDESIIKAVEALIVPSAPLAEELEHVTVTEEANVDTGDVKQSEEAEVVTKAAEKSETTQAEPSENVKTESDTVAAEVEPQEDVVVKVDVTSQLTGKDGNPHMNFEEQPEKADNITESVGQTELSETEVKEDATEQSTAPPMETPEEVITPVPQIAIDNTPETINKNTGEEEVDQSSEVKEDTTEQSSTPPMQTPEEFTAPVPQIVVDDTPETISKNTEEPTDDGNTQEQLEQSKAVQIDSQKVTEEASKAENPQEVPGPEQQTADDDVEEEKSSAQEQVKDAGTDEAAHQQVVTDEPSSDVGQDKAAEPVESATVEHTLQSQVVEKVEIEVKAEVTDLQTEESTTAVESQVEAQEATQSGESEAHEANDEAEETDKMPVEENPAEENVELPNEKEKKSAEQNEELPNEKEEAEQSKDIAPKDEGNAEQAEDDENNVPTDSSPAETTDTQPQQPESTPEVQVREQGNAQVESTEPKAEDEEAKASKADEKDETNTGSDVNTESSTKSEVQEPKGETEESGPDVQQETNEQAAAEQPTEENVTNDNSTKAVEDQVAAPEVVEKAAAVSTDRAEEAAEVQEAQEQKSASTDDNTADVAQSESKTATASEDVKTETEKTSEVEAEAKDGDLEPQIQITQTESDVALESDKEMKTETDATTESAKPSEQEQDPKVGAGESHAPLERKISLTVPENTAFPDTFEGEVKTQEATEKPAPSDDTLPVEGPGEQTRRPSITVNSPEGEVIEQVLNQTADMTKDDVATAEGKEESQEVQASEERLGQESDATKADASQTNQISAEDQKVNEESPKVESEPSETAAVNGNVQPSVEMHEDEGLNSTQEPPKEEASNAPLTNGNIQPSVDMHEDDGLDTASSQGQESAKANVPLVNGNVQPSVDVHEDEGLTSEKTQLTNGNNDTQHQQSQVEEKPHVPIIMSVASTAQSKGSDLKAKMEGKLNNSNAVAYPGR